MHYTQFTWVIDTDESDGHCSLQELVLKDY